jgi:hypothetical protein
MIYWTKNKKNKNHEKDLTKNLGQEAMFVRMGCLSGWSVCQDEIFVTALETKVNILQC